MAKAVSHHRLYKRSLDCIDIVDIYIMNIKGVTHGQGLCLQAKVKRIKIYIGYAYLGGVLEFVMI